MVTSKMGTGCKERPRDLVRIFISMVPGMKGNGGKINSMDGVTKFGQMELNLKAAMNKELKLGKVNSNFQTVQRIKESLQKT